jgi:hypothetical protein
MPIALVTSADASNTSAIGRSDATTRAWECGEWFLTAQTRITIRAVTYHSPHPYALSLQSHSPHPTPHSPPRTYFPYTPMPYQQGLVRQSAMITFTR